MNFSRVFFVLLLFTAFFFVGCLEKIVPQSISEAKFTCENNPNGTGVQGRGYVLLMGYGGHHKEEWDTIKRYMEMDPKTKFAIIYDQDEAKHINEISNQFLAEMNILLARQPVDELVIFGSSAGGVTSSYSIANLNFSGSIVLHTLASPLNGYGFSGIKEQFLGNRSGFMRDIAIGFQPYAAPQDNVKVYHHKTVTDTILVDHYCKNFELLCNALEIQDNNVPGSKEYFYPEYDHDTIMYEVIRKVLKCYNANLKFPTDSNPTIERIGIFCTGEEECALFCHNSRGQCLEYCAKDSTNSLCQNPNIIGGSQNATGSANRQNLSIEPEIDPNVPPVLKNLGVNIEPWNKSTDRAGDIIFNRRFVTGDARYLQDRPFVEFGYKPEGGQQDNIEYWFYTPLGTKLTAPVDGFVSVVFFNHTQDWGINIASQQQGTRWITSFEHVVNLNVKNGDVVKAGDVIAEAAPRNSFNYENAMVELAVWTAGQNITKHCPFLYLEEDLKPIYSEKLTQLANDWEQFAEKDVYAQQNWIAPGCLTNEIKER